MSNKVLHRVWEHSKARGAARCLMLALADVADERGIAYPGVEYLAEMIRESVDHTGRLIDRQIEAGELFKIAGRGRGVKTRFAVLIGLPSEKQAELKGVLQNPFSEPKKGPPKTPLPVLKRGHVEDEKGVIFDDKRGHVRDSKHPSAEQAQRGQTPIVKKTDPMIQDHDPGGGGARARAAPLSHAQPDPMVALFARYDITAAEPLARLYREHWPEITIEQLARLCEQLAEPDAGEHAGARLYRKLKAGPYERQQPTTGGRPAAYQRGRLPPSGITPATFTADELDQLAEFERIAAERGL